MLGIITGLQRKIFCPLFVVFEVERKRHGPSETAAAGTIRPDITPIADGTAR
jgi:hypothetical protein